jgi:pimeloyl-ACP methyl ester carboxylesterase
MSTERAGKKRAVADAPGARHASVRFVTGRLDRFEDRSEFLAAAEAASSPILMVYGDETPPKPRAEMLALSRLKNVETVRLPRGKLSIHEEFATRVAPDLIDFLSR